MPPHPARVGPPVAVVDLLVVARRGQRHDRLPVAEGEEGGLRPPQELLDEDPVPRRAEDAVLEEERQRALGVLGDSAVRRPFRRRGRPPSGRPGSRTSDRPARLLRGRADDRPAVGIRWRAKNSFANTLEDSICDARRVGPKIGMSRLANSSTMPSESGSSGPTTVRSMRSFSARSASSIVSPASIGEAVGELRDPRVARRAVELVHGGAAAQRRAEGVLPPSSSHDQDFHGRILRSVGGGCASVSGPPRRAARLPSGPALRGRYLETAVTARETDQRLQRAVRGKRQAEAAARDFDDDASVDRACLEMKVPAGPGVWTVVHDAHPADRERDRSTCPGLPRSRARAATTAARRESGRPRAAAPRNAGSAGGRDEIHDAPPFRRRRRTSRPERGPEDRRHYSPGRRR